MKYTKLGRTGLDVSRICLGCMSYGGGNLGNHAWSLPEEESRPFIKKALEAGINFFDTANRYSLGSSEEILGRAIKDFARRDEVVIATKVYGRMRPGPNGAGLSRKAIFAEIDNSLRRLGMDYVDLYQVHRFDHDTPIEETLEALHDVVKAGKARYIGASSMHAWQFARALGIAEKNGWTRFVPVLDPGRGRTKTGYFWSIARDTARGAATPARRRSSIPTRQGAAPSMRPLCLPATAASCSATAMPPTSRSPAAAAPATL